MKNNLLFMLIFIVYFPPEFLISSYGLLRNINKQLSSKNNFSLSDNNYIETYAGLNIEMVFIQGGTFYMGCTPENDTDCFDYERPRHKIMLSDFYMAKTEVTVAQFELFVNETSYQTDAEKAKESYIFDNKGALKNAADVNWRFDAKGNKWKKNDYNHPVIHVSWNDAKAYCDWLSNKTKKIYRLPTEAQWEYAARNKGKDIKYSWGNESPSKYNGGNIADISTQKKFKKWTVWNNYNDKYIYTAPVNSFGTNDIGLADMSGNVTEMCIDWYGRDYYKKSVLNNPENNADGACRVIRGGSWSDEPNKLRCSHRSCTPPKYADCNMGFRICKID